MKRTRAGSRILVRGMVALALVVLAGGCGSPAPSPRPSPTLWHSPTARPTPTPRPTAPPATVQLAVVARYDDLRSGTSVAALRAAAESGTLLLPCEIESLSLENSPLVPAANTPCLPAEQVAAAVAGDARPSATAVAATMPPNLPAGSLALLPASLVVPELHVLPIGEADLFGAPKHRALPYPLTGQTAPDQAWVSFDGAEVRTLISTGDTCPDRGFSHLAVVDKRGWDWTLAGGTARYTSFVIDKQYSGPHGGGWLVPRIKVAKDPGKVADLISDNDVSANDFECPMVANWVQHDGGTIFSIDPRVAPLLAKKGGLKVVTLGSNHMTNAGLEGVRQTIHYLDAAGIKHTGAGLTLEGALAPAVVDAHGVKFAFVGWDDIKGSAAATSTRPGVAPMTDANVCRSLTAARKVADVVIAMPQWGWPEYHNTMTAAQRAQRARFYECGADGVLGSGTHWASWASILPGPNGPLFAIGSHGNFFFDQNWSQETMEGVVVEATFLGRRLVQFRLHPYVVYSGAQPNLLDPARDGQQVMKRVWSVSEVS